MTHDPYAYEAAQRRRIRETDWDKIHRDTARGATLQRHDEPPRVVNRFKQGDGVRRWRGGWLREHLL